ncbi:hypothetical protein BGZ79_005065 [Entomortierella chlamydospora]|nr:hypothetical protein BGZ79_005065 [Entomortierella chlamydospora]
MSCSINPLLSGTEAQHRRFTENPEVRAALQRNGKYIRVIQVETCKSLAPFLNVDADLLKNIHTLQLPYSIGHDEGYPGITYSDTTQTTKRLETKSVVPWRISDWLQEKEVFLMYHEVALRMLRIHQIQSERIRDEQLEKLAQTIDQAQQQLSASLLLFKNNQSSEFETDPKPRRRGKYFHCPPRTKSTIARLAFKLINGGTVTSHQKAVRWAPQISH